jgi:hypothetical protein
VIPQVLSLNAFHKHHSTATGVYLM